MGAPFVVGLADAPALGHPERSSFIQLEPEGVRWPDTALANPWPVD